ncbi:DNA-binding helix-turn-helix protein [Anaerococcus hydrogenalis DSM 7454]|uniref:DNA-binding helix-turn-helix protein n=2 Tax=Anaerococcus hydrogenalis TaxID=33029 RepID=B6WAA2_9FIRM|nr:helix-turn-helix transcriptional regulator [Anaerococcus hydrogenalis]EEB35660.1 DNA-binding helix-turn-helix protein [Anaerococcus hydrogenalis DSM 7454]
MPEKYILLYIYGIIIFSKTNLKEKGDQMDKLGKNIKNSRISQNLSLKKLAEKVDVSPSMLSQIESGKANPSLNTLKLISQHLKVPMFTLFIEEDIDRPILVKKNNRIRITNKGEDSKYELSYDLLSPDTKGDLQLCEMKLSAYQYNSDNFNFHNGEEVAVCTLGKIELILENKTITLETGDSVRIPRKTKHRWKNPSKATCAIIFSISPPIF